MNDKRREYRDAGLPVLVEASITDSGEVRLEWLRRGRGRWQTVAVAVGENLSEVIEPQPFQLVPNSLVRQQA